MIKETFKRIFNAGWKNFRRNSYVSVGTTGVMTLVLLLFLSLLAFNVTTEKIVGSLHDKVDVSVYFKTEASVDQIAQARSDLQGLASVQTVQYVSQEQALADFRTRHAGDALIQESLDELDHNPLQASLNIKAADPTQYAIVVSFLEAHKFRSLMDKINFYENEQVIERIQGISGGIQNWGFMGTLVLAMIAVLVTFNTIRLTIYNQKSEVEIMRLVGGSNWYIRGPYMVEGALYGTCAAVIALLVFYPFMYAVSPKISVLVPDMSLIGYFGSHVLRVSSLLLVSGVFLGVVSSTIAIRRFLKV